MHDKGYITLDLIRKKSEHNGGIISTLEEITLHQEDLDTIGPVIGGACGKSLRILLLQSNHISRLEPQYFRPFKVLEYLNLALNHIRLVEGLEHLEFLSKLDLTSNFIGIKNMESSIDCLSKLRNLKSLYLLGNPCCYRYDQSKVGNMQNWDSYRLYVVSKIKSLQLLDGKEITVSDRYVSDKRYLNIENEIRVIVKNELDLYLTETLENKRLEPIEYHDESKLQYKKIKKHTKKDNNIKLEQMDIITKEKCYKCDFIEYSFINNEGNFYYRLNHYSEYNRLHLEILLPLNVPTDLISIDIRPYVVSVLIISTLFRLTLWEEANIYASRAQRNTVSGNLAIIIGLNRGQIKEMLIEDKLKESVTDTIQYNGNITVKEQHIRYNTGNSVLTKIKKVSSDVCRDRKELKTIFSRIDDFSNFENIYSYKIDIGTNSPPMLI